MRKKGIFRLLLIVSVIYISVTTYSRGMVILNAQEALNVNRSRICAEHLPQSDGVHLPPPYHEIYHRCFEMAGGYKTPYEHLDTFPFEFWLKETANVTAQFLLYAAALFFAFLVARWVLRGFRNESGETNA